MTARRNACVVVLTLLATSTIAAAQAAEPGEGRWAAEASACTIQRAINRPGVNAWT